MKTLALLISLVVFLPSLKASSIYSLRELNKGDLTFIQIINNTTRTLQCEITFNKMGKFIAKRVTIYPKSTTLWYKKYPNFNVFCS